MDNNPKSLLVVVTATGLAPITMICQDDLSRDGRHDRRLCCHYHGRAIWFGWFRRSRHAGRVRGSRRVQPMGVNANAIDLADLPPLVGALAAVAGALPARPLPTLNTTTERRSASYARSLQRRFCWRKVTSIPARFGGNILLAHRTRARPRFSRPDAIVFFSCLVDRQAHGPVGQANVKVSYAIQKNMKVNHQEQPHHAGCRGFL